MPAFSPNSIEQLNTADPRLIKLFQKVILTRNCTIMKGHRGKEEQRQAFLTGKSKLDWPNGNHNSLPSRAVDAAPYPVEFPKDTDSDNIKRKKLMQFCYFAGYVMAVADGMGIRIRWGGDWDRDNDLKDNNFDDLVHFELLD